MKSNKAMRGINTEQLVEEMNRVAMGPERRIAYAVIIQSIKDCSIRRMVDVPRLHIHGRKVHGKHSMRKARYFDDGSRTDKEARDARRFLEGSLMLQFWCNVIGISHRTITELYLGRLR
jgi:hypothetical protein